MAYDETQMIGIIKGVDEQYDQVTNFSKHIKYGKAYFKDVVNEVPKIVLGLGVSNKLSVNEQSALPMNCYAFKKMQHLIRLTLVMFIQAVCIK